MSVAFNPFLKFPHILPDNFMALNHFFFVCLFCLVLLLFCGSGKASILYIELQLQP